jgi:hypothetical protein
MFVERWRNGTGAFGQHVRPDDRFHDRHGSSVAAESII